MREITFNRLWNQIYETIDQIETSLDDEEKKRVRFHRTYGEQTKQIVWDEYVKVRDNLKHRCYSLTVGDMADDVRIDHHKIAACFCNVLCTKKIFSFDIDESISGQMLLSNYRLAYVVSLRIIYLYMLEMYISSQLQNKEQLIQKLKMQETLCVPNTSIKHDKYHLGRIKALALNDWYRIPFDILGYADMMYWIEHYNRQLIEGKIEVVPYDPDTPLK